MKSYSVVGFVIKRRNHFEADRVLTVFSKYHGKLFLIAKGIRKVSSKRSGSLEQFSLCKMLVIKGKTWDIITETEIISTFANLRSNLKHVAFAYQICEILDRLLPEKQVNSSLFNIVMDAFENLDGSGQVEQNVLEDFLLKIIKDLGYLPKERFLEGEKLSLFLENIIERKLNSNQFLTKVNYLT